MFDLRKHAGAAPHRSSQLVGHDHPRHIYCKHLQQPTKETLGSFGISPLLHENVEYNTILIHGAPEVVLHPLDANEHLASRAEESRLRALPEPYVTLSKSYGSRCSVVGMHKAPMREEVWAYLANPCQPIPCAPWLPAQAFELVARPTNQDGVDPVQGPV